MTALHIGSWVRRERAGRSEYVPDAGNSGFRTRVVVVTPPKPVTRGHHVESIIDGDAITTCGRRMRHRTKPPLVVHAGMVSRAGRPLDWDLCGGGC